MGELNKGTSMTNEMMIERMLVRNELACGCVRNGEVAR